MGIHWTELLVISVIALLIFGPKRLPEMGSAIGKTYQEFKKSLREVAGSSATEIAPCAGDVRKQAPAVDRPPMTHLTVMWGGHNGRPATVHPLRWSHPGDIIGVADAAS
jgi:sec-independent protein translocase protein TatA